MVVREARAKTAGESKATIRMEYPLENEFKKNCMPGT
jgi:hypothetical protein